MLRIEELLVCLVTIANNNQLSEVKENRLATYQLNYLDKQEVMQLLKISDRQLYNLRKKANLPCKTIKGKLYFKLSDIERICHRC
ncbi:MAG TPA: helix-turn-helix domain-containing protein [Pelobium sp.]|nr:helix-turn-helix domain-containing protein [Pelobium sp.]